MIQEQIRIRELETALEANRTLLALESRKVHSVHSQLICIGQELGGEQFDQFLKGHLENELTTEELAAEIIRLVKARLGFTSNPSGTGERKDQAAAAEQSLREARRRIQELEAALQASKIPPTVEDYPAWFEQWQKQRNFERERKILLQVGRSSLENLRQIGKMLAGQEGESSNAVPGSIEACCQEGLLERVQGQSPDLVLLTGKGLWAYTRLLQATPSSGENASLLNTYRTVPHPSLVLRTAELFTRLGYAVDQEPKRIPIDTEHGFQPDLVVSRQGETFYLQVETGLVDDRPSLAQKWEQTLLVGGGRICVVTGQLASMNSVQSQIIHWAVQNGKKFRLYVTYTEFLKWIQPGKSPWARIREL
jgi:hypothetical protein